MKFTELPLDAILQKAIVEKGYTEMTPIQSKAIVSILAKRDVLGCAQTGTGKTAAFAIPMIQLLEDQRKKNKTDNDWDIWKKSGIKSLIITPTRELATQIDANIAEYSKGTGITHTVIFGGVGQQAQVMKLERGVDIVTATPGRLLDLMNQGFVSLKNVKIFTLDEADRMLDMGFLNDIKKIIQLLPEKKQSLFFSATMPSSIVSLADTLLKNPKKVTVAPISSASETVEQKLYLVQKRDKKVLLTALLKDESLKSVLVFTRTKHMADKISDFISEEGIGSAAIHGNKSQNFRQNALQEFKDGKIRVLVATDLASRGIDIDQLSHVINYEIPNEPETYIHRIGRTGRAHNSGIALSFCDAYEVNFINDIHRLIGKKIPIDTNHEFHASHPISTPSRRKERKLVSRKVQDAEFVEKSSKKPQFAFQDRAKNKRKLRKKAERIKEGMPQKNRRTGRRLSVKKNKKG